METTESKATHAMDLPPTHKVIASSEAGRMYGSVIGWIAPIEQIIDGRKGFLTFTSEGGRRFNVYPAEIQRLEVNGNA